jgi:flagellar export protein FliJ
LSFRFENLLKLRKSQEYQAQKFIASINRQIISHKSSLKILMEEEKTYKQSFDQRLKQNIDINTRRLFDKYFDSQKIKISIKKTALEQMTNQFENKRTELVSAIKRTRPLEIIKQRDLKASNKIAMTKENNCYEEASTLWRGHFS